MSPLGPRHFPAGGRQGPAAPSPPLGRPPLEAFLCRPRGRSLCPVRAESVLGPPPQQGHCGLCFLPPHRRSRRASRPAGSRCRWSCPRVQSAGAAAPGVLSLGLLVSGNISDRGRLHFSVFSRSVAVLFLKDNCLLRRRNRSPV